ncbi:anthrone oxygenase family protein [Streptomyces flavofungini]|uniref:anthrone oxygenase family protein n=1 Tax=Streptomyces flavofungini TaxID=68200 RepID=UPI0034DF1013
MTRKQRYAGPVLGAATLAMGLIAGTFYAFACAVMPGLARSDDRVYIAVMRDINEAIQNPVFFAGFFGALLLTALSAWQQRGTPPRWWVLAALLVYAAAFVLTSAVNVPLNNELAAAGDPAELRDPSAVRERFEDAWVAWNAVRAVLCSVACASLARGLVLSGRGRQSAYLESAAGSTARR